MKIHTVRLCSTLEEIDTGAIEKGNVDLLLVHGDIVFLEDNFFLGKLKDAMPNAEIIGCSSIGEFINDEADEGTIVYTAIEFEKTKTKASRVTKGGAIQTDFELGQAISSDLSASDLKCIILFYDVFAIGSDDFMKGLESLLPHNVPILGGAAADNFECERTVVVDKDGTYDHGVVALGLYGESLVVQSNSSYFDQEGSVLEITKVDENKVLEINGKPAAQEYKKLLNVEEGLEQSAASTAPFIFLDAQDNPLYCRAVIQILEEENALLFSLQIPLGKCKVIDLSEGGLLLKDAQRTVSGVTDPRNEFAYIINCCARRGPIGDLSSAEARVMHDALNQSPVMGFYSFAEIGRSSQTTQNIVNNFTVTVGAFYEV